MTGTSPSRGTYDTRAGYLIACLPYVVLVILSVLAPTFLEPIFANPPSIAGLPAGTVILAVGLVWGAMAFVVIWATANRAGVFVAQLLFTMPSLFAIILTGPVIQIIEQLGRI
jgi:hypothetical protein